MLLLLCWKRSRLYLRWEAAETDNSKDSLFFTPSVRPVGTALAPAPARVAVLLQLITDIYYSALVVVTPYALEVVHSYMATID